MVGERRGVDFLARMRLLLVDVEIVGAARAMVGADEVDDALGDVVLVRQLDAVSHVRDDDFGTFGIGEVVMRTVSAMLVFSEIHRILDFPDVVIQGTRPRQKRVAADFVEHFFAQVGDLDGMLERAWSRGRQLPEQRRIGVAQLQQRKRSGHAEEALQHENNRLRQQSQHSIEAQEQQHPPIDFGSGHKREGEINQKIAQEHEYVG